MLIAVDRKANLYIKLAILLILTCIAILFLAAAIMANNYPTGGDDDDGQVSNLSFQRSHLLG